MRGGLKGAAGPYYQYEVIKPFSVERAKLRLRLNSLVLVFNIGFPRYLVRGLRVRI